MINKVAPQRFVVTPLSLLKNTWQIKDDEDVVLYVAHGNFSKIWNNIKLVGLILTALILGLISVFTLVLTLDKFNIEPKGIVSILVVVVAFFIPMGLVLYFGLRTLKTEKFIFVDADGKVIFKSEKNVKLSRDGRIEVFDQDNRNIGSVTFRSSFDGKRFEKITVMKEGHEVAKLSKDGFLRSDWNNNLVQFQENETFDTITIDMSRDQKHILDHRVIVALFIFIFRSILPSPVAKFMDGVGQL